MTETEIGKLIILWYQQNKRNLPWRAVKNPYFTWLSEIILQQTKVEQGLPYFNKFISQYPDIKSLAQSTEKDVLSLWQGLGYYNRARNLHSTAKKISYEFNGEFPSNYFKLLELPGIGKYTASAISSIAFNEKEAVVDGNVFRFLSRLYAIEDCIDLPKTYSIFRNIVFHLMGDLPPGDFNQAIMEIGATICTPKDPKCYKCPVNQSCSAHKLDRIKDFPVRCKKTTVKTLFYNYLVVINDKGEICMRLRDDQNIWANMYDFPLTISENQINSLEDLPKNNWLDMNWTFLESITMKPHLLSHRKIIATFWIFSSKNIDKDHYFFYSTEEIAKLPKPTLIVNFLNKLSLKNNYL